MSAIGAFKVCLANPEQQRVIPERDHRVSRVERDVVGGFEVGLRCEEWEDVKNEMRYDGYHIETVAALCSKLIGRRVAPIQIIGVAVHETKYHRPEFSPWSSRR